MRETQMLLAMGYTPKPRPTGLAAPALHEREGKQVYDSEMDGTVPIKKPCGEHVRDLRRSKFSTSI